MINLEKGYTLVEALIVLSLVFIVTTISFVSFQPLHRHLQINHFFNQLQLDISYAQMYAMSHNNDVHISFLPASHQYIVQPGGFQPSLIKRSFSEKIDLQLSTLPATVTFMQTGMIRMSGKMYVRYYNDYYVFVFLFGKGQTYVNKL